MTTQQINSRLQDILTSVGINLEILSDKARFNGDLGLDSLDVTDLLIRVESSFGMCIPDEDWWQLQTVGELKAYLLNQQTSGEISPELPAAI